MNINGTSHSTRDWFHYGQARHAQLLREAEEARLLVTLAKAPTPRWRETLGQAWAGLMVHLHLRPTH